MGNQGQKADEKAKDPSVSQPYGQVSLLDQKQASKIKEKKRLNRMPAEPVAGKEPFVQKIGNPAKRTKQAA